MKGAENRRWKLDKLGMEVRHSRVMSYRKRSVRSRGFHHHSSLQSSPASLLHGLHGVKGSFECDAETIGAMTCALQWVGAALVAFIVCIWFKNYDSCSSVACLFCSWHDMGTQGHRDFWGHGPWCVEILQYSGYLPPEFASFLAGQVCQSWDSQMVPNLGHIQVAMFLAL